MTGRPGKWPPKNHSRGGDRLLAADVAALAVLLQDAVDEQERPAVRDELLQLGRA